MAATRSWHLGPTLLAGAAAVAVAVGVRGWLIDDGPERERVWPAVDELFDTAHLQVPVERIRHGGPGKDGIPALTEPAVVAIDDVDFLELDDRVIGVTVDGRARAYPLRILDWHEIVNDVLAEVPIAVIYCPLCDSVSVVDRRVDDVTLEFGVTGLLLDSNVLMYDRTHEALWSQLAMTAVSGPHAGRTLRHLDGWAVTTFERWASRHPEGSVMGVDTGYDRPYHARAYPAYGSGDLLLFPVDREDDRYPRKTPVIGIRRGDRVRAYLLPDLFAASSDGVRDTLDGGEIVLRLDPDTRSVEVVAAPDDAQVVHSFWFAWYAFHPDTEVWSP